MPSLNINIEKKVKSLRTIIKVNHYPYGLSWIKTPQEHIGIYISNNLKENFDYNFQPNIAKLYQLKEIVNTLSLWFRYI